MTIQQKPPPGHLFHFINSGLLPPISSCPSLPNWDILFEITRVGTFCFQPPVAVRHLCDIAKEDTRGDFKSCLLIHSANSEPKGALLSELSRTRVGCGSFILVHGG